MLLNSVHLPCELRSKLPLAPEASGAAPCSVPWAGGRLVCGLRKEPRRAAAAADNVGPVLKDILAHAEGCPRARAAGQRTERAAGRARRELIVQAPLTSLPMRCVFDLSRIAPQKEGDLLNCSLPKYARRRQASRPRSLAALAGRKR